ncbi:MAG: cupin-like domain-containing protein [Rhodanobacteraceae bacterium]
MNAQQTAVTQHLDTDPVEAGIAVDRRNGLGIAEFNAEYRDPRRPVILTDASREWPVYGRGTPEYFRSRYGERKLPLWGAEYRLADLLDLLAASSAEQPGPYPCKYEIARSFRELLPEVSPRFRYSLPDRQANRLIPQRLFSEVNNLEIFFGGSSGQFPYIHYDVFHLHAWITQLHGDKEFTLYAPNQEPLLYVNPEMPWQSGIKNHHRPDYERYPLFRQANSRKVVIHAGETLFLPCGWWHTARSLNLTISVAFDQLGADNWADFVADVGGEQRRLGHRGKALMLGSYLSALDPLLWLGERMGVDQSRQWGRR